MHDRTWPAALLRLRVEVTDAEDVVDVPVTVNSVVQRDIGLPTADLLMQQATEKRGTDVHHREPGVGASDRRVAEAVPERDAVSDLDDTTGAAADRVVGLNGHLAVPQPLSEVEDVRHSDSLPSRARPRRAGRPRR